MQLALSIKIKFGAVALQHAFADPFEVLVEFFAEWAGSIELANFDLIHIFIGHSILGAIHHFIDRLSEWAIRILIHNIVECEVKGQSRGDVVGGCSSNLHFTPRALHEVRIT